jgi:hypothetical protein
MIDIGVDEIYEVGEGIQGGNEIVLRGNCQ